MCVIAGGRRRAVPMLDPRGNPHDVALPDPLRRLAPLLDPAGSGGHDQRLAERVGMPCRSSTRVEPDGGSRRTCGLICLEKPLDSRGTREVFCWSALDRLLLPSPDAEHRLSWRTGAFEEDRRRVRFILPLGDDLSQDGTGVIASVLADVVVDDGGKAPQLRFREARVEAHLEMRRQLGIEALQGGQGRDGRDLSALHVQVVAAQDVSEEMALQERVDGRAERGISARRRPSHQLRQDLGSELDAALVGGQGLGSRPTSSAIPLRWRSSRTSMKVLSPFRLRGNPAYAYI